MDFAKDIYYVFPELTLILGAMLTLLYGAFFQTGSARKAQWISLVIIAAAMVQLYMLRHVETDAFNGMFFADKFSIYSKFLIGISGLVIVFMMISVARADKYMTYEMSVLALLSIAGMMLLVSSGSLLSLYMSLELMSLPLYIMAASDRKNSKSTEAGMKYFILGSLASGLYLYGTSLVYGFTGHVNFDDIILFFSQQNAGEESISMPIGFLVGLVFITVAICFKVSAVPFHMWTPDVYQGSPTIITAFFASAPKIAGITLFIRILFDPFADLYEQWKDIITFIAIASMLVGSLGALLQTNMKRLLAYSSIGHVGFAFAGIAAGDDTGITGVLIYLSIYMTMTLAAFACLLMVRREGRFLENISDLAGISKSHPLLAFAMATMMLSMAGIPPLAGFFAKFYVLLPAIQHKMYGLSIIFVISSVIAAYYYLKVVKVMYFDSAKEINDVSRGRALKIVASLGTAFNIGFIFFPNELIALAKAAVLI